MDTADLVVVSMFRSVAEARIAKGILDEVGIESTIRSDNAGGMYPALDAAAVVVRSEDLEAAAQALNRRRK